MMINRSYPTVLWASNGPQAGKITSTHCLLLSSPTYSLSKNLAQVLSQLVGNTRSSLASITDFVSFLKSVTIQQEYKLVLLNVVVLFTNIPTELAVSVVGEEIELDEVNLAECTCTPCSKDAIISLLRLILS